MTENLPEESSSKRKDFICGVVEGFYGRPWTTEQRKDLFQKLKKWNMDMYVYAPKDDYKHRAYWRELYTVEEAEHLTSLINDAKAQGITFCYALSPGLDITYSSQKEITALKRKLEQVSQFGCTCFALLFDDIEPEMSEADKQTFQSFAHAQVTISNEMQQHLGGGRFLVCPTQYCASRAAPSVTHSEYLNTLGTKLAMDIDIMWTGPKVISKTLTTECIEEITQVLRRPPVIWDNLHANDYDQKRIFLGPYCGRSPSLIPLLRGVLSNPNVEYHSNLVPIYTLAHWAACTLTAPQHLEAVSWDVRLERESDGVDEDTPLSLAHHEYHPREALRLAINEWIPEFSIPKTSQGPVIKPQPPIVPAVSMIPIVPSLNTCMSVSAPTSPIPCVSTTSLHVLSDVTTTHHHTTIMSTTLQMSSAEVPVPNPIMNSLVSPTKVVLSDTIPNPIVDKANSNIVMPQSVPVSTLPLPLLGLNPIPATCGVEGDEPSATNGETMSIGATPSSLSPTAEPLDVDSDVPMNDTENGSMQVEATNSPLGSDMIVEPIDNNSDNEIVSCEDLMLVIESFYLPFQHGPRAVKLLTDLHHLLTNANQLLHNQPPSEWLSRRSVVSVVCSRVRTVLRRISSAPNQELATELLPYLWDLAAVLALLDGYLSWLELKKFPANIATHTQGSYTWFSKGWRAAFESGAQEPWVFRGGVTADLRRLVPAECTTECIRPTPAPRNLPATIRPYTHQDRDRVLEICHTTCHDGGDCTDLLPPDLQELATDRFIAPYLELCPEFCLLLEEELECDTSASGLRSQVVGFASAALNCREFATKVEVAWMPDLREKYPKSLLEREDLTSFARDLLSSIHSVVSPPPERVWGRCGAGVGSGWSQVRDPAGPTRLLTCLFAALRANGVSGCHVALPSSASNLNQFYSKQGFIEITSEPDMKVTYLGRSF